MSPTTGRPTDRRPPASEVDHILENVNRVLDVDLRPDDAVGAFAGLRPLVGVPGGDTARVSREHTIHREDSGLVRVSGGKYTTYRLMARDARGRRARGPRACAARRARPTCRWSAPHRTPTSRRWRATSPRRAASRRPRWRRSSRRHGTQARDVVRLGRELDLLRPVSGDVPHLEAEVAWAVREELALGLDDVLSRRMRLSMARRDRGASLAPRVAAIMGAELGWDDEPPGRRGRGLPLVRPVGSTPCRGRQTNVAMAAA